MSLAVGETYGPGHPRKNSPDPDGVEYSTLSGPGTSLAAFHFRRFHLRLMTFAPFGDAGISMFRTPPAQFGGGEEINLDSLALKAASTKARAAHGALAFAYYALTFDFLLRLAHSALLRL